METEQNQIELDSWDKLDYWALGDALHAYAHNEWDGAPIPEPLRQALDAYFKDADHNLTEDQDMEVFALCRATHAPERTYPGRKCSARLPLAVRNLLKSPK